MTKPIFLAKRVVRLATVGAVLAVLPAGCEPINAEILQNFVFDFARSALAAWLL